MPGQLQKVALGAVSRVVSLLSLSVQAQSDTKEDVEWVVNEIVFGRTGNRGLECGCSTLGKVYTSPQSPADHYITP